MDEKIGPVRTFSDVEFRDSHKKESKRTFTSPQLICEWRLKGFELQKKLNRDKQVIFKVARKTKRLQSIDPTKVSLVFAPASDEGKEFGDFINEQKEYSAFSDFAYSTQCVTQ